jgi:hypothetical protein
MEQGRRRSFFRAAWLALAAVGLGGLAVAQEPMPVTQALRVDLAPSATIVAGRGAAVRIVLEVTKGLHVQANPAATGLVPLAVKFSGLNGISFGRPVYPPGTVLRLNGTAEFLNIYEGEVLVDLPVRVPSRVKPGTYVFHGSVSYQACDAAVCFPPKSLPVALTVFVRK